MGIYVNPGNAGFQRAVDSKIYVDKSGMLEYFNEVLGTEQNCICISRPRRFGKSITAGMLTAYYDRSCDSHALFQNLKVAQTEDYERYLNRYDVIHLDITSFRRPGETSEGILHRINSDVIAELQELYPESFSKETTYLPDVLAEVHNKTGAQFVIIIDEWDALFREDKYDTKVQIEYVELLRGLFKSALSKKFVKLAYLTGILPIKKYGTESALNNFDEFTMVNADYFAEYTGFTEQEVKELCDAYHMDFSELKRWYDGYLLDTDLHVYNPKSVVVAIRRKRVANYWTTTETSESLKTYISMNFDGLKDAIVQMLTGMHLKINVNTFENDMTSFQSKDDVLTVMVHLGYLAYDRDRREVYIPNEEVRSAFTDAVQMSNWKQVIDAVNASEKLLLATLCKQEELVAQGVDAVYEANTSILNYNDENALSCVITLAYYQAMNDYQLVREMPLGKGYADIVFLPKKHTDYPALVVELKYDKSVDGAIEQIKEKRYAKALESYSGKILLVGINYDKVSKKHSCKIEEWEK